MPIAEHDISILIPTFRQPVMARQAVLCALNTGAGELLVSDDCGGDGVRTALADIGDPRLQVFVQPNNLGLWPNHRWLLERAGRPWIKYLQHDDRIVPGGLAAMAAAAGEGVAVVSAVPLYCDLATGRQTREFELDRPLRFTSEQYLQRLQVTGNELGTPSCCLFRKSALDTDERSWRTDVSADMIANIRAASRGDVVLLPPGPVVIGTHAGQDVHGQGFSGAAVRFRESLKVLSLDPDPRIRDLVGVYGTAECIARLRMIASSLVRGRWPGAGVFSATAECALISLRRLPLARVRFVAGNLAWRYGRRVGRQIRHVDGIPDGVEAGVDG